MSPRLRVSAGTNSNAMVPITSIVNTSKAYSIHSELFQGQVVANIKGITDEYGRERDSEYFTREDRQDVTWSIQVQGSFLVPTCADDILFGNIFDRPLKIPWGTSAILKFMHYLDPTLEHDLLTATKPWALSPLICTMPHFMHTRVPTGVDAQASTSMENASKICHLPPFPPTQSIKDSTDELYLAVSHRPSSAESSGSSTTSSSDRSSIIALEDDIQKFQEASQRRSYFSSAKKRELIQFGPMDVITTDFCYGFLNFAPPLSLQLPGGFSLDLMKYWDGQPVKFVCCERKGKGNVVDGSDPWGREFWCVALEMVNDEE